MANPQQRIVDAADRMPGNQGLAATGGYAQADTRHIVCRQRLRRAIWQAITEHFQRGRFVRFPARVFIVGAPVFAVLAVASQKGLVTDQRLNLVVLQAHRATFNS